MNETFKHIRQLLSNMELRFTKETLTSGAEIEYEGDTLVVGVEVDVITEDGERIDAPNGEHETVDGTSFITVDGVVTELPEPTTDDEVVEAATEETVEAEEDEVVEAAETNELDEINNRLADLESRIDSLLQLIEQYSVNLTAINDKFEATTAKVEQIANSPVDGTSETIVVSNVFNKTKSRASQILGSN